VSDTPDPTPGYAECAAMTDSEMIDPGKPRHVLLTHRPWMNAYCSLDAGELSFRLGAVRAHDEGFNLWLWCLALYRAAMSHSYTFTNDHESEETRGTLHKSEVFRLEILGLAGGNIKLAPDAALAGYYSGCMALERHMLETWRRSAYARLHPEDIWRWFPADIWPDEVVPAPSRKKKEAAGKMPTWPPEASEIADIINCRGDEQDKAFLPKMESGFAYLNSHSHPTLEGATQTWHPDDDGRRVFGPTFSDIHCVRCLHWGLSAGLILLWEVSRLKVQGEAWVNEFGEWTKAFGAWDQSHSEPDAVDDSDDAGCDTDAPSDPNTAP
jgi:hypothetical protein